MSRITYLSVDPVACPAVSSTPLFDRQENVRDRFATRFGAEISFAVNADAHGIGVHVAFSDYEHGVDFHLFGALDFAIDLVGAFVQLRADFMSAQFVQNRSRVIEQLRFVTDGENAHLFRRQPEREIAGVMLDQKSDETFVRAKWRPMNADWNFLGVVAVLVTK